MIFNLVEAAQEFLSGIEPISKPTESVSLPFYILYCTIITNVIRSFIIMHQNFLL